jgi:hypothetical protein
VRVVPSEVLFRLWPGSKYINNHSTGGVPVMDRRVLGTGLAVLASSFLLSAGVASAHGGAAQGKAAPGTCTVKSLPSFVAQGEFSEAATVGDVIEVSCDPFTYSAGATVTVTASQLFSRCHEISWYKPNESGQDEITYGRSVTLKLDVDGNANVGLIAGPKCMVGESLITVDENEAPYETYTTSFMVLPAVNTPQGLYITPASQVEDQESSGVVTIAQAEFNNSSEKYVRIGAGQLYNRCHSGDKLEIVQSNREVTEERSELLNAIKLDNNGNGFVLLMGTDSCAEGPSLIEADLEESPFTTLTGTFTVESPRVR